MNHYFENIYILSPILFIVLIFVAIYSTAQLIVIIYHELLHYTILIIVRLINKFISEPKIELYLIYYNNKYVLYK